jgi:peptidyl-prolyl cis-trans isomerase C
LKINASHILVKTETEAWVIIGELNKGGNFEDIAKKKSLCPSKKRGGSLGWFTRGQMVKPFENACFSGKKGQIAGPVKTEFGYHVIRIDDLV